MIVAPTYLSVPLGPRCLPRLVGAFPPCDRGPEARESDKRHDSDGTGRDRLDLRPSGSGQDGRHRPWEPRSHPRTVRICARTIVQTLTSLGANHFDLKYGMGGLRQQALMTNIELYGTEVIPRVRELLADQAVAAPHATPVTGERP